MQREVPAYNAFEYAPRKNDYCVCIFVINEGQKLLKQLEQMQTIFFDADVVIADGGSSDSSTDQNEMTSRGVNSLLVKTDTGKLGSQMRMAFDWAITRGYKGVITIDGNGKDGVDAIPDFIDALKKGIDHVQGSRFIPGGYHSNTPFLRLLGVKLLHAPLLSLASGFCYTDTTNGFRAYSRRLLNDDNIAIFRKFFTGYELHYYLAVASVKHGYNVKEIPVSRRYPEKGPIPTKISPLHGNLQVFKKLIQVVLGKYNKKDNK